MSEEFDIARGDAAVLVTIYLAAMRIGQPLSGRFADVIGALLLAGFDWRPISPSTSRS
jgi:MFS family permease